MFRTLTFFHVVFAGFFLPAAVVFSITGGLYTWGVKGSYESKSISKTLELPADPGLDQLTTLARSLINEDFQQQVPSGSAGLRKVGTSWAFDWSGSRADFSLEPTKEAGVYKASYKQTDPHRFFVQLHKAKGGWPFKVLAAGLALGFLILFATGVALAFINPRLTRVMVYSLAFGVAIFTIAACYS
ncbi:MAG: hypothetical protein KF799_06685 [Bdellovibrionales bacterium]|nr:hypothetical protein [Bdellovibrionales bacterium]